jgi:light-regulated signal transduction histidine kinase (bacteriophytochrome)
VALTAFGCTIPLALVMGWLLGRKLTMPIKNLTIASERIAGGDLNYRVDSNCSNETGMLSSAFNKMAQNLQDEIVARGKEIVVRKRTEKRLAELNEELEVAVDKLSEANRDLSELTYVTAHDLKAPARAIGSLASMMALDYSDKLDDEGKKSLGLLVGRSERMTELLNAVLEYSQIGRVSYEKERVNTNELVQKIIAELGPHENIEIIIENELPVIKCVRPHISLVFKNLIGNAVRFMDKPKGLIKIGCIEKNGFWHFSVADNGPGIESRYFVKIFKLFQTLKRRDELEAVGMGLALAKKILDIYNGAMWVDSEPGKGSTFFFALPTQETADKNAGLQTNIACR